MTRQTNGMPELKYSEETFRDMYEKLSKVRAWLVLLAKSAETKAKTERFVTLRDAYIADAKMYRATIADIDIALAKAEEK